MTNLYMEGQKAQIDRRKCVGCGACIPACPAQAIRMLPGWFSAVDTAKCIGCGNCIALCHKQAPCWVHSNSITIK